MASVIAATVSAPIGCRRSTPVTRATNAGCSGSTPIGIAFLPDGVAGSVWACPAGWQAGRRALPRTSRPFAGTAGSGITLLHQYGCRITQKVQNHPDVVTSRLAARPGRGGSHELHQCLASAVWPAGHASHGYVAGENLSAIADARIRRRRHHRLH